jgi:hypothetical protein
MWPVFTRMSAVPAIHPSIIINIKSGKLVNLK